MNLNKNKFFSVIIALIVIFSQLTVGVSTTHSVSGTANIFIIEFAIIGLSAYVVFFQLLLKRKILTSSKKSKYLFVMLIIFCVFYFLGLIYRFISGQSLAGSFLLARIIIEVACSALIIDYFDIDLTTIFTGLILARSVNAIIQFYTLVFGDGQIRGPGNMLDNSVTEYSFLILLIPTMVYYSLNSKNKYLKIVSVINILISGVPLILSGSRVAFPLGVFMIVVSTIAISYKNYRKEALTLIISFIAITFISCVAIGLKGSNENRQNLSRSVAIPVSIYNKIVPSEKLKIDLNKYSKPTVTSKKTGIERNVSQTIELSNDMRYEINSRTKKIIFENPKNFLFGIGASSVPALNGNQKPHNLILLYMLAFGLIGTIICYLILFYPLISIIKKDVDLEHKLIIFLTYLPIVVISTTQPILGTLIICLSLYSLTFSWYRDSL